MAINITLDQMLALYEFELSVIQDNQPKNIGLFNSITSLSYTALTTYLEGRINYCKERIKQYGPKAEIDLSKDS